MSTFTQYFVAISLFVTIAFPKAGFYIHGNIPLNICIFLLAISAMLILWQAKSLYERKNAHYFILALACCGFGLYATAVGYFLHARSALTLLVLIPNLILFPIIGLLFGYYFVNKLQINHLGYKVLTTAFYIVCLYGLFEFCINSVFKHLLIIPHVTTTHSNASALTHLISNMRPWGLKLISTYNNGNILGINLLMWGTLVYHFIKRSVPTGILGRLTLILTGARTVWLGLLVNEILFTLAFKKISSFLYAFLLAATIAILFLYHPVHDHHFFHMGTMNGRTVQFQQMIESTFFPHPLNIPALAMIKEIVYASMATSFGFLGLILFCILMLLALLLHKPQNTLQKVCQISILTYLFLMWIDGAFILIPTQFVFWFMIGITLYKNPPNTATVPSQSPDQQNVEKLL